MNRATPVQDSPSTGDRCIYKATGEGMVSGRKSELGLRQRSMSPGWSDRVNFFS